MSGKDTGASGTFAVIGNHEGGDAASLLSAMAAEWRGAGAGVVGVLAEDNADGEAVCSAGFLRDIVSGRPYSIHLDAPPAGRECHLDAIGVEDAGAGLLDQISAADIVILSKFGKLEAAGQGLWPAFAAAIEAGKPLLTTVSSKHVEALKARAPAVAWLEADQHALQRWWHEVKPGDLAAPAG